MTAERLAVAAPALCCFLQVLGQGCDPRSGLTLPGPAPIVRSEQSQAESLEAGTTEAASTDHFDGGVPDTVPAGEHDAGGPVASRSAPLPRSLGRWTYTEFPDTQCRDGSATGVAVNLGSARNKVMIYLEGGGFCSDELMCFVNSLLSDNALQVAALGWADRGVLDRTNPENPVGDWSFVYVPYCTGDLHGGANPEGSVPGVGPQKFMGHVNMTKFLARVAATFPDATDVLLTGHSAGGFGVWQTSMVVQAAFPKLKVKTISDSGMPASNAVLASCMQRTFRTLWRLDDTILRECGDACPNQDDYWRDYALFIVHTFRDRPSGLIMSAEDALERALFGTGNNACSSMLDLLNPGISAAALRADLLSFRARVQALSNFSTIFPDSEEHAYIATDAFYVASAGGTRLVDWFRKIVSGESPDHAGP